MRNAEKKPITLNKDSAKQLGRALTGEYSFVLSFIVLVFIGAAINPNFFTWGNISNLFVQGCMIGLIAMGMTMVIGAGLIDISVGSQVALIGGFGIWVLNATNNVFIMLLFCIATGLMIGLINGLLVTKGGMPPMVATLATMSAARAIINYYGSGGPFTVSRENYDSFRKIAIGGIQLSENFKIPTLMIILVAAVIVFDIIMKKTALGKHIFAVGSNEKSARLSGINVDGVKIATYMFTGAMCGIAALIYASRMTAVASASAANGWEMDAIAAVAIGGTSMTGGRGKIMGTFLGVLMFRIISNVLTVADISSYLNGAISAAIIVLAVLMQNFQNKRR